MTSSLFNVCIDCCHGNVQGIIGVLLDFLNMYMLIENKHVHPIQTVLMSKHFVTSYTYDALALRACGVRTSTTSNTYTLRYDVLRDWDEWIVYMYRAGATDRGESHQLAMIKWKHTCTPDSNCVNEQTFRQELHIWCLGIACLRGENMNDIEHVHAEIWRASWLQDANESCTCTEELLRIEENVTWHW